MSNGIITVTEMHLCHVELPFCLAAVGGDMSKTIEILYKNKVCDENPINSLGKHVFVAKIVRILRQNSFL